MAALVGDELPLDVVALATTAHREDVLAAVDEAMAARLVESATGPGRFRLIHALARGAALEGVGLSERVRPHGSVGDALETRRDRGHAVDPARAGPPLHGRGLRRFRGQGGGLVGGGDAGPAPLFEGLPDDLPVPALGCRFGYGGELGPRPPGGRRMSRLVWG